MAKQPENAGKAWTKADVDALKKLAKENTPTRVIGLKLGRSEDSIYAKAAEEKISLKPTNQSPYNRQKWGRPRSPRMPGAVRWSSDGRGQPRTTPSSPGTSKQSAVLLASLPPAAKPLHFASR